MTIFITFKGKDIHKCNKSMYLRSVIGLRFNVFVIRDFSQVEDRVVFFVVFVDFYFCSLVSGYSLKKEIIRLRHFDSVTVIIVLNQGQIHVINQCTYVLPLSSFSICSFMISVELRIGSFSLPSWTSSSFLLL